MNDQPLKDILPKFVASLADKGRSPATILAYRSDLEQLINYLAEHNRALGKDVVQQDLENFRDFLLSQKYTAKSVSRKLNAVKTFFRWLKEEKHVAVDPSRDVAHPEIESTDPKFLTENQYRALRDIVRGDIRISTIIEVILQTGMRISEIANLRLADVDGDTLKIRSYATQPERTVPVNKVAKDALENYLRIRPTTPPSEFVFVSKNGKPLAVRNIRAAIDRYMQRADIPEFSVNDLRTTFIIENLKRGVDLVTISQIAGHKRLSTTERYVELAGIKESGKKQELEIL